MHVGIISQWYDPEPGPASVPGTYARMLAERGHRISVLTGFPNYPTGDIYSGYEQRLRFQEDMDGVSVHRVPLYPSHDASAIRRSLNYASFALSASVLGLGALKNVDVIWSYNSPVTVGFPLRLAVRRCGAPYLLHVQDLWPQSVMESGMVKTGMGGRMLEAALSRLVAFTERGAGMVAVVSPSVRRILVDRGIDDDRIVYIPNPIDEGLFYPRPPAPDLRTELGWDDRFVVLYAGSMGEFQGLETAVEAMSHLRGEPFVLAFLGSGPSEGRLRALTERLGLHSVEFMGRVHPERVPSYMSAADVQLVSLRRRPLLEVTTPSKIAAMMAAGEPILGAIGGDGAELIRRSGAGVVVAPGEPAALAEKIRELSSMATALPRMGQAGRSYYEAHLSSSAVAPKVEAALSRLC